MQPRYTFSTMQVYEGRAVVAVRVDGTGLVLVITHEDEMRQALGLKPPQLSPCSSRPGPASSPLGPGR